MTPSQIAQLEELVRYILKVGYNHGWQNALDGKVYNFDFGKNYDLNNFREPEKSLLRALLDELKGKE